MQGEEFRRVLKRLGLTPYGAAPFLGLSRRHVLRIAAGEYDAPLAAAKLLRLMVRLKLEPDDVT